MATQHTRLLVVVFLLTISGTIRSVDGMAIGGAQVIGFPDQPGQRLAITQTAADGVQPRYV
jgi:hypothetical protein